MAFESLHEIAKQSRKSRGRASGTPKAFISITQAHYKDKDTTVLTFRLTAEAMQGARLHKGDRADIAYDRDSKLWRISAIQGRSHKDGYAVSGSEKTGVGQIRLTHYSEMPLIAERETRKARGFSDDETIKFSLGEVIFSIKNVESDEANADEKGEKLELEENVL